jgi:rhodanese-related sulfurtransferase
LPQEVVNRQFIHFKNSEKMHVHESNPKKTLVTFILFAFVILIGFLTLHKPRFKYKLTLQESIQMLSDKNNCFYPWQLPDVLNKTNPKVVLIDIRNKFAFSHGHIPGAENISAFDLTKEKNMVHLKALADKGITVVLYGTDQLQANDPWMWFRMTGFSNIKYLAGGYNYYKAHSHALAQTKNDNSYLTGIARYDYAKLAHSKNVSVTKKTVKKPVIIRRRKKAAVASGGC